MAYHFGLPLCLVKEGRLFYFIRVSPEPRLVKFKNQFLDTKRKIEKNLGCFHMQTLDTILITISIMILIEGLIIVIFPIKLGKAIKKIFKNKQEVVKIGLIEVILALLILFIISL